MGIVQSWCAICILLGSLIGSILAVSSPCDCPSLVLQGGKCQESFSQAVCDNDGIIKFGGTHIITAAMDFRGDLDVRGVECAGEGRAKVIGAYSSERKGMFSPKGPNRISITFSGFDITSEKGEYVSALRTSGGEGNSGNMYVTFKAYDIQAYGMWNKRLGAVFFLGNIGSLIGDSMIADDCKFWDNKVQSSKNGRYHGGAVLAVGYVEDSANLYLGGQYKRNSALYTEGTQHCAGGAVYIDNNEGTIITTKQARFENNVSNEGGAIAVLTNRGALDFQSTFIANRAIDEGESSRAGAVRVVHLDSGSSIHMSGKFVDNVSDRDGGVIAVNVLEPRTKLVFSGVFHGNIANGRGALMSQWSRDKNEGLIQVLSTAKVANNRALGDMRSSLFKFTSGPSPVSEKDLSAGVTWYKGSSSVPQPRRRAHHTDPWRNKRRPKANALRS